MLAMHSGEAGTGSWSCGGSPLCRNADPAKCCGAPNVDNSSCGAPQESFVHRRFQAPDSGRNCKPSVPLGCIFCRLDQVASATYRARVAYACFFPCGPICTCEDPFALAVFRLRAVRDEFRRSLLCCLKFYIAMQLEPIFQRFDFSQSCHGLCCAAFFGTIAHNGDDRINRQHHRRIVADWQSMMCHHEKINKPDRIAWCYQFGFCIPC